MRLEQKKEIAGDLHDRFLKTKIVIATDYKGLDVEAINDLRRKLRESGSEYQVVKNTLLRRAAEDTDVSVMNDVFKGPTAIALNNDDPVAPAKVLVEFAKQHDKLTLKGGVMQGKPLDMDGIKRLSDLPSREVLLSQVLSTMNAVPSGLVRALADVPRRFLNVLSAVKDQKDD